MEDDVSALPLAKAKSMGNWTSAPQIPESYTLLGQPQTTRDTAGRASLCKKASRVQQQEERALHVGIWVPGEKRGENGTGLCAPISSPDNQETPEDRVRPHGRPAVCPHGWLSTQRDMRGAGEAFPRIKT